VSPKSAAPISTCLRLGASGCFRNECCTSGESTAAAPRVKSINVEHEAEQAASTFFQVFGVTWPGIEPILPASIEGAQPINNNKIDKRPLQM